MVPAANLLGFTGQELARKLPHVLGVVMETTFGSVVELILFIILLVKDKEGSSVLIIKAAILGSILANLLLCLGFCFFFGGLRREEQEFHEAVSEVGSNLMLVAGMGLVIPAVFSTAGDAEQLKPDVLKISRGTSVILIVAYAFFIWYQVRSHKGLYEDILQLDEEKDEDAHRDALKKKLTLTEAIIGLIFALTIVSFMAYFLVNGIHYLVDERGVKDA
jgi:Ca2+:H+ antiporter